MYCSVAVVSGSGCIAEYSLVSKITHSKRLLATIAQLMQECQLSWSDLHGFAVSLGPGSFTGLRIALTTVKGLCMATGLPLMGVSSLKALAVQFPHCSMPICPILDARKQEVYTGLYRTDTQQIHTQMEPVVIGLSSLIGYITGPTLFVGDGVSIYQNELRDQLADNAIFAPPQQVFPRASAVGILALQQFTAKEFLDPASASPLYIRPSDAEVNLKKKRAITRQ